MNIKFLNWYQQQKYKQYLNNELVVSKLLEIKKTLIDLDEIILNIEKSRNN